MGRTRHLIILVLMILLSTWACATSRQPSSTTTEPTFKYNPAFNCSFKEAWDGVLVSLDESGVNLIKVDRESGWAKGWFTEWDGGMYATYYISVTVNEIKTNEWRILVSGSFEVTTPIAIPKARGYLRRRVLRVQETITKKLKKSPAGVTDPEV